MDAKSSGMPFADSSTNPGVRGFLHRPTGTGQHGLVLAHGAGSNCQSPLLIALAEEFAAADFIVLRCDLPYRQARPYGPPRPGDAARDREGLRNAVRVVRNMVSGPIFLGGHSYGGRQATMLVAEDPPLAAGLLLLSYPLHPPGKPQQLRTQHFPEMRTPALFAHGVMDPFGTIQEMTLALKQIPAKVKLLPVAGGHDLGFKGKSRRKDLPSLLVAEFRNLTGLNDSV